MIIITKSTILRAVSLEKLKTGRWAFYKRYNEQNYPVDIIGAVIKQSGVHFPLAVESAAKQIVAGAPVASGSAVEKLLAEQKYLNALSCFFEENFNKSGVPALRKWVKENIPDDFRVHFEPK